MTRILATVATLAVLAALLAGCTVTGSVLETAQDTERWDAAGDEPTVIVETFNGRIVVTAAADGVVDARVTRRGAGTSSAAALRDLANVRTDFYRLGDRFTITARRVGDHETLGNSGADVEVSVPAGASVELRTSNGRVESANVEGSVIVRTSNGAVVARGGHDLDLDTTNGQISVSNPRGRLSLRTSNGGIDILAANEVLLSAQTSNDPITFSGTLAPGLHRLATSNGGITVMLPGDASFRFDGQTSNGSVRTEFGDLTVTEATISGSTGRDIVPDTTIIARTSNGDLAVMAQRP